MKEKLQPIERRPDGSLPRMTPGQRKRANALIRATCCNYDNGNCILLDDGEECVCIQSISYSQGGSAAGQSVGSGDFP